jgi:hypothetical protein
MSERLSTRARAVLVLAQQESKRLGHEAVAPEHLLASLIAEGRGIAARTMSALGVGIDAVRREAQSTYGRLGRGEGGTAPKLSSPTPARAGTSLPYSDTAKRVLERAVLESEALSDPVVATEHILLAFTCDTEAAPARLLERLGHLPGEVRRKVLELRAARLGPGESTEAPSPPSSTARSPRDRPPGDAASSAPVSTDPASRAPVSRAPASRAPVSRDRASRDPASRDPATRDAASRDAASRQESARRAARSSSRAYEPGLRGRWKLAPAAGDPPAQLVARWSAGPRCPGCSGLLEGHLAMRRVRIESLEPRSSSPAASVADAGDALEPSAAPDGLRLVYCSACGHVLHAEVDRDANQAP